ncbi:MAG: DEAD/DEAH box helicase family protein, partial [Synechococcaceae cyanobacterium]
MSWWSQRVGTTTCDAGSNAPSGAGKGQTIGAIVQGAAGKGRRVLVLAHRAELIEQLTGTVRAWGLEADVIAPGLRLQGRQVAVGSV